MEKNGEKYDLLEEKGRSTNNPLSIKVVCLALFDSNPVLLRFLGEKEVVSEQVLKISGT